MADLHEMPPAMRRLAVVQFFSWFALFAMWIYTTAAVTQVHYGTTDPQSAALQRRRELGGCAVRVLQRFCGHRGRCHSAAGAALRPAHQPPDQSMAGRRRAAVVRADSRSALADRRHGRRRIRLGLDRFASLRTAVQQPARRQDGRLHGHLQFLHRDPTIAGRQRARLPVTRHSPSGQPIYALVIGGASLFIAGLAVLRVAEPVVELAGTPSNAALR